MSLSVQTRRGSTRWEACAAEGQGGRSPAPVRKPGKGVGGGALGLVRYLEEPLPRAAAAGVLEQQQPALLPCVAAAVARGSDCSAKSGQRRRSGAFHTLGYARPVVLVAPERSRAMVRRIFTTGDGQGAEEESDANTHLRARYTTPFKALGASRGSSRYCPAPWIRPKWPPSPYRLGSVHSWGSVSSSPGGRVELLCNREPSKREPPPQSHLLPASCRPASCHPAPASCRLLPPALPLLSL